MDALAQELVDIVSSIGGIASGADGSELYRRLGEAAQSANGLARMRMYMDGGKSFGELKDGAQELIALLADLDRDDWAELLERSSHRTS
jgi:hypothetical protein